VIDAFPRRDLYALATDCDVVVVLGGDGTMLSIARTLAPYGSPLIGINQGRLGFLTDITADAMFDAVAEILSGQYVAESRILLNGQVRRNGETVFEGTAFNDVVVGKGITGRLIELEISINGEFVYSQRADGLVATTPTGTTAYALSAGGPIVHPTLEAIALVPICPHTLSARPIVVSGHSRIEITLTHADDGRAHFDGQLHFDLKSGDQVWITRASRSVTLLHPHAYSYYDTLREKLHWGKKL
jgi:NAD+ kinase